MAIKIYHLLEHTNPTVPFWQVVPGNKRVKTFEKRPVDHAYIRLTYADKDGKNHSIRLKLGCDEIDFNKQVKEYNIPANESFTQAERDSVKFTNGILMTKNETVQKFLEASPQMEGFEGTCDGVKPLFKVFDPMAKTKITNEDFRKRLKAANRISAIVDLKEAQDLMIRLNGTFFKPPNDLELCTEGLIEFLDHANDPELEAIVKEEINKDEELTILISRAILGDIISFDAIPGEVARKRGNGWVSLKKISSEHSPEERQQQFAEFLSSEEGRLLMTDLKKAVSKKVEKEPA